MGEIEDDMTDGTCCWQCGAYFKNEHDPAACFTHGYPVICRGCWSELDKHQRRAAKINGLQRAIAKTL